MIQMQLPSLHIVHAAGNCEEIVIHALFEDCALIENLAHDIRMLRIGNVLVAVAAEHVFQGQAAGLAVL